MNVPVFVTALLGGMAIGAASALMMFLSGRIAGISGITFNAITRPVTQSWSVMFLLGLLLGTALYHLASGAPIPVLDVPVPLLLAGGLLVGLGTKLGSGCTSGHGICGLARLSARSLVAVVVFMASAMITVFVRLHGSPL